MRQRQREVDERQQPLVFVTDGAPDRFGFRPYQKAAIAAMMDALRENDRHPACIAACGAGKTVIMGGFIEAYLKEFPDENVLVLAHRTELITQAAERFSHVLPHDLVPAIHCASLGQKDFGKVTVASVQTIGKPDILKSMPAPGLVIVDEAHRIPLSGDGQYQRLLTTLGSRHHDMRVAGFTATPWRLDGGYIIGPGHPLNTLAYQIEPHTLMTGGFLVWPAWAQTRHIIETGKDAACKVRSRKGDFLNADLSTAAALDHKERIQDLLTWVAPCQGTAGRQHVIVFTIDRKHARKVAQDLPDSIVIDGETPPDIRAQHIQDFAEGKYRFLINVDLFIEGFDLPKIDAVAVLRPTQSAARWMQMVGRGLRTADGKTDCLVLDYGGNRARFPIQPDAPGFFNYNPAASGATASAATSPRPIPVPSQVELPPFATYDVDRVRAAVFHSNHKDRDFLKISWYVGLIPIEQTLVVPSTQFRDFWARHGCTGHGFGDAPVTPQDAMTRINNGDLVLPRAITVRYRANPDKPFGYSEIVHEIHSWAETMKYRHTFFKAPLQGANPLPEPTLGGNLSAASMARPTPIYGQQIYADLIRDQANLPGAALPGAALPGAALPGATLPGQWVTAYPTDENSERVYFEQPICLLVHRIAGMTYVAEKDALDQALHPVFQPITFPQATLQAATSPGVNPNPLPPAGHVNLLAPYEMGQIAYAYAQAGILEQAETWWTKAAEQGDSAARHNLKILETMVVDTLVKEPAYQGVNTPSALPAGMPPPVRPEAAFHYGGRP